MQIITSISEIRNLVDGWDIDGDLTREQQEKAASAIRDRAHRAGLTYGEDWEDFLNTLSTDDVRAFAE